MKRRSESGVPYTSDELRQIADQIDEIAYGLSLESEIPDDSYLWGLTVSIFRDGLVEGKIAPHHDGWFGFYPESWGELIN